MTNTNAAFDKPHSSVLTDPVRNFRFVVTFEPLEYQPNSGEGMGSMGFVSVSGLTATTESIAYREGGFNTNVHQIPGQTSFTPITFSKGVILGQTANQNWMKRIFALQSQHAKAGVGAGFRNKITIKVLSHPNPAGHSIQNGVVATGPGGQHASMEFIVRNAWITSLSYGNLDAGANSLMVEEMTCVHEGFDVSIATNYLASAALATA